MRPLAVEIDICEVLSMIDVVSREPWIVTDTTGPAEAVFAIRFDAKPIFILNILNFRTPKFRSKIVNNYLIVPALN